MRFYVDKSQIHLNHAILTGEDVNHIKNVLRMHQGDGIILCDKEGAVYDCTIKEIKSNEIECYVCKALDDHTELPAQITLFQGLPKKDKMEWIIQKAVELGATRVVPVLMERTIVKLEDKKKEEKKLARWQSIAVSASKQCGRGKILEVTEVVSYQKALEMAHKLEYTILPYEKAQGIEKSREQIRQVKGKKTVGIFIGPEGGITQEEYELAIERKIVPITLGGRILRTETAGMATLTLLMFELEEES